MKQAHLTQPMTSKSSMTTTTPSTSSIDINKFSSTQKIFKPLVGRVTDLTQESSCDEADESEEEDDFPSPTQPDESILNLIKQKVKLDHSNLPKTPSAKRPLNFGESERPQQKSAFSVHSSPSFQLLENQIGQQRSDSYDSVIENSLKKVIKII